MKTQAALLAMIAMDYWDDHADRARAAWNDILGTLKVGEFVESPFRGPGAGRGENSLRRVDNFQYLTTTSRVPSLGGKSLREHRGNLVAVGMTVRVTGSPRRSAPRDDQLGRCELTATPEQR